MSYPRDDDHSAASEFSSSFFMMDPLPIPPFLPAEHILHAAQPYWAAEDFDPASPASFSPSPTPLGSPPPCPTRLGSISSASSLSRSSTSACSCGTDREELATLRKQKRRMKVLRDKAWWKQQDEIEAETKRANRASIDAMHLERVAEALREENDGFGAEYALVCAERDEALAGLQRVVVKSGVERAWAAVAVVLACAAVAGVKMGYF